MLTVDLTCTVFISVTQRTVKLPLNELTIGIKRSHLSIQVWDEATLGHLIESTQKFCVNQPAVNNVFFNQIPWEKHFTVDKKTGIQTM